jgi:predicted ribosome quality control (RQC) complex YloA/Tae2 family protein
MIEIIYENDDGIDYRVLIGKNAQDNWDLISSSDPEDLWFHCEDIPSCHVVLKENNGKKKIPMNVLKFCSEQCKLRSQVEKKINIIYTKIKNVKKGSDIGSVYTKNTKRIKI